MSEKLLCEIFKSSRKDEMYLYVDKRKGMETVPEALMETGLSDLCRDPCRALYRSANEPATAVARNRGRSAGRRA